MMLASLPFLFSRFPYGYYYASQAPSASKILKDLLTLMLNHILTRPQKSATPKLPYFFVTTLGHECCILILNLFIQK
jgi:hypothetical protein